MHPFSVLKEPKHLTAYNAYGAAVSEVEVDVLTGEIQILRVDILYDCGNRYNHSSLYYLRYNRNFCLSDRYKVQYLSLSSFLYSLSPMIDIGQVEGAFVMGIGYWLTEKVVHDKDSGQLLTHNTWVDKPTELSCEIVFST